MPRPPPPAAAFTITGPCASSSRAPCSVAAVSATGTPDATARARARSLSPNSASNSAGGPTNLIPAAAQARASAGDSLKNPQPGCSASARAVRAAAMTAAMSRYAAGPVPGSAIASAMPQNGAPASSVEKIAIGVMPHSAAPRITRLATSPRLATNSLFTRVLPADTLCFAIFNARIERASASARCDAQGKRGKRESKQGPLFLKKKKQKDFCSLRPRPRNHPGPEKQSFSWWQPHARRQQLADQSPKQLSFLRRQRRKRLALIGQGQRLDVLE